MGFLGEKLRQALGGNETAGYQAAQCLNARLIESRLDKRTKRKLLRQAEELVKSRESAGWPLQGLDKAKILKERRKLSK